jgi:hypothetical protein
MTNVSERPLAAGHRRLRPRSRTPVTRMKGDVAFRCALVRRCPKISVRIGRQSTLHHAFLGYLAIYATTNRRPLGLLSRSWTRIYAAGLCRARNSAARTRPQRRQRQRRIARSTFRLSGVSRWPLPQISGIDMGSRIGSREKHTT